MPPRKWKVRAAAAVLALDNSSGMLGFCALEYGVSRWSVPAAWVLGGVILMACAAWPALKRQ